MAWPKRPHFKGDAKKRSLEATAALPPSGPRDRNLAAHASKASDELVIGTMVEAIDMAHEQQRPDRMVQAASELGKLRGMYVDRSVSLTATASAEAMEALAQLTTEELRALASGGPMPQQPHHEAPEASTAD